MLTVPLSAEGTVDLRSCRRMGNPCVSGTVKIFTMNLGIPLMIIFGFVITSSDDTKQSMSGLHRACNKGVNRSERWEGSTEPGNREHLSTCLEGVCVSKPFDHLKIPGTVGGA